MERRRNRLHARSANRPGMKLLLDTHGLIWLEHAPDRLGDDGRAALAGTDAEVHASHVSLWEMAITRGSGKLTQLDRAAAEWFAYFVPRSGLGAAADCRRTPRSGRGPASTAQRSVRSLARRPGTGSRNDADHARPHGHAIRRCRYLVTRSVDQARIAGFRVGGVPCPS